MKNLKNVLSEDDFDDRMAAQKKRKSQESALEQRLTSHYTHVSKNKDAVQAFTNMSGDMNSYLWEKHKNSEEYQNTSPARHEKKLAQIKTMDEVTNAQRTPESFTVYSTSRHDPREHMDSKGIMLHPAYLSTSIRQSVPEGIYSGRNSSKNVEGKTVHNIFHIKVPKNHPGVYISDRNTIDKNAKEFILPRGEKLKHIHTHKDESSSVIRNEHHLEIVPKEE